MRRDKDGLVRYAEYEGCEGIGSSCEGSCGWDDETKEWICHKKQN